MRNEFGVIRIFVILITTNGPQTSYLQTSGQERKSSLTPDNMTIIKPHWSCALKYVQCQSQGWRNEVYP